MKTSVHSSSNHLSSHVMLVGAGCGDPDLLTIKALKAIQAAQVVVYDRLVSDEVLALIPAGVPKIYAGKSCKIKAMPQEEINELLIMLARKYSRVVRLKGGDPYLFARGGEEALELARQNIPFEVVAGITSAQGCSAAAGIPLTHRGLASSVRYITGHRQDDGLNMDWAGLADENTTLVIYMGLVNIETITQNLITHGLPPHTPAAIIERGTTLKQRVMISTLENLCSDVEKHGAQSPSLIIIGRVVSLRAQLAQEQTAQPQSQTSAHPQSQSARQTP